jgi:hypothetical protein
MEKETPNKFVEMLKQPENMATAIVLGASLLQPREAGRGGWATAAQRGAGALAFRGQMGVAQEGMERQRAKDQQEADEQASQAQYRQDTIGVQQGQLEQQRARTVEEQRQFDAQGGLRAAQETSLLADARYKDRLPQQNSFELEKLQLGLYQERDKFYNGLGQSAQEGFLKALEGINAGLLQPAEKLAAEQRARMNYAQMTQAIAALREREMAGGPRGYIYMTPQGEMRAAWGFSDKDPSQPVAAGIVPPPGPTPPAAPTPEKKPLRAEDVGSAVDKDVEARAKEREASRARTQASQQDVDAQYAKVKDWPLAKLEAASKRNDLDEATKTAIRIALQKRLPR